MGGGEIEVRATNHYVEKHDGNILENGKLKIDKNSCWFFFTDFKSQSGHAFNQFHLAFHI